MAEEKKVISIFLNGWKIPWWMDFPIQFSSLYVVFPWRRHWRGKKKKAPLLFRDAKMSKGNKVVLKSPADLDSQKNSEEWAVATFSTSEFHLNSILSKSLKVYCCWLCTVHSEMEKNGNFYIFHIMTKLCELFHTCLKNFCFSDKNGN